MLSESNRPMRPTRSRSWFTRLAKETARWSGRPISFLLAFLIVVVWLTLGPIFHYSDSWQLVINTGTTIVTFLMVFLIQNAQYRDAEAVQVKLDELLRVTRGAHTALLSIEELEDHELDHMHQMYEALALKARQELRSGRVDTGVSPIDLNKP